MIKVYENACMNAGISKERTATIRNYIDGQKKRVRRRQKTMEKLGISFTSTELITEADVKGSATLATAAEDPLEKIIHDMDIQKLRECISKLSNKDKKIILTIYGCDDNKPNIKRAAEQLHMKRTTVSDHHRRILSLLKAEFFKEETVQ